ncbi:VWA domain-containing protein [Paenalcaligenes niemegkensis]|uniref:vWA domain-containing protein n=1 Tax=Paenalcaligenes niemegkensis TaxID=2895469 RepID=UPI001EE8D1FA|nr:vWA domain-containing protein [Paenalcaligenes niemegkensis]MCQ9615835.1 VWA domain-containing protein [Paenalcaligenes niemegkensis]
MIAWIPIALDYPVVLLPGIVLMVLPWLFQPRQASLSPYIAALPDDRVSYIFDKGLRLIGSITILALSVALAGLHIPGGQEEKIAQGAHLVLLIDRSTSMNESFGSFGSNTDLSKAVAAKLLLRNFAEQRDKDQIGVVAFSTAPMPILPLTAQPEAINAAINAIDHPGLSHTDIGRALLVSLNMLQTDPDPLTSRAVVLVSDGAGVINRQVQEQIRTSLLRQPVQLYWLFIRSTGTPSIYERPSDRRKDTPQAMPERHLHLFFESLGIPYLAFEAESPAEVSQALEKIDEQEQHPLKYTEDIARTDLGKYATMLAMCCLLLLMIAHLLERSFTFASHSRS